MTPEELEPYEQLLRERQQKVEHEIAAIAARCDAVAPDQALGRLTRTDAMQDQQVALHQRRQMSLQQTQIGTALTRIQKGTFGICVMCKHPIAENRLGLVPESPLCLSCSEQRAKSGGAQRRRA